MIIDRNTNALMGTFLDISGLVSTGGDGGMLGLAFDPSYFSNGRFYVSYRNNSSDTVVARYLVNPLDPNQALPIAERIIMTVEQPTNNRHGGMITFGPGGHLYIARGDGGGNDDEQNRAQNLGQVLGKILRIDVSQPALAPEPYAIPPDNPCVGLPGARGEIWSIGLRNPLRFSFDRLTGDLYLGDVGDDQEEVNVSTVAAGSGRGANYGWKIMDGRVCFSPEEGCDTTNITQPVLDYEEADGACAVTGGYVYRGIAIPALSGTYFYADRCEEFVRSFRFVNSTVTEHFDWASLNPPGGATITSISEDAQGELYITTLEGDVFRIVIGPVNNPGGDDD